MAKLDLAQSEDVLTYLANTPFRSVTVTPLVGGMGNYTFRLRLHTPYEGQTSLVLKHGKPYIPGNEDFALALERQRFEVAALRQVKGWLREDDMVAVPAVHSFDEDANVIIMDDCGESVVTLKQLLLTTSPQSVLARQMGTSLGVFLARLHSWGGGSDANLAFFAQNKQARELSAFITYGRLVSTLADGTLPALSDPPLSIPQDELERVEVVAKNATQAMLTTQGTLVMGDFWPGNVLVKTSVGDGGEPVLERLWVVDWELVRPGVAGVEIGQFCAELTQVQRFSSNGKDASIQVRDSFLSAYRETRAVGVDVVKAALIHVGAHLVTWTPRVPWGGKETVREVVLEGLGYLVNAQNAEEEYLKQSLVGKLLL
ncbi:hypothetical protein CERSUDRAFT_110439 [Gelatoporia subvermispora B]|uniref:Aminoglycoside phosphotransferase domain-containing protein n=1 Tax=Ceriporiopsis subvermispora (strain B) TaxID=914234 RepID=M2RBQ9_CERS8|nr:hypothetical protein CERSUDRAFT_110439 [Gelatoporia subvermispora B]